MESKKKMKKPNKREKQVTATVLTKRQPELEQERMEGRKMPFNINPQFFIDKFGNIYFPIIV